MTQGVSAVGPWTLLILAGLLEIVWALGFKYVRDGSPLAIRAGVFCALISSFVLLVTALRQLPAGTAYAVWTGIGASGVAILGMLFFREPATVSRIVFIGCIIIGIVGLRLTHHP
jgi:quaternary ammonium compound-resistance protein SugE